MAKKQRIPHKFLPWIDARKKFRLSNAHIQMARELGLSPKRFASYADTKDQPWKVPLPEFIQNQYEKQFGKERPDVVQSIEEIAAAHVAKRAARKAQKLDATNEEPTEQTPTEQTPTEQTPTEQTPTEQTPTEQTPTEQTPTEQTPTD